MGGRKRSYSLCPAVCGCRKGRGEDEEVISVVEEGLRTDVCVFFLDVKVPGVKGNM